MTDHLFKSVDKSVTTGSRKTIIKFLLPLILAGAALRIYISFFSNLPSIHRDSTDYLKQADAILNGDYINYFPNGYPLLVAITKALPGPFTPAWMIVLNVLLSVATLYLVYLISKKLFDDERVALLTIAVLAFMPTQINLVRWVTSEVSVTFFLLSGYYLYIRKKFIPAGIALAMSTFIRTEMFFIFLLILLVELFWLRKINLRLALAVIVPLILIGFWCKSETGEFAISGHGRVNIMYSITASGSDIDWEYIDKHPEIRTEKDAINAYIDYAKENPQEFLKQKADNLWEMWGLPSSADGTRGMASRIMIAASNLFLVVFGLAGWWLNRKKKDVFVLILPFIVITGLHTMMFSLQRYTFPVEPFLVITAAWFVLKKIIFREKSQAGSAH